MPISGTAVSDICRGGADWNHRSAITVADEVGDVRGGEPGGEAQDPPAPVQGLRGHENVCA